MKSSLKLSLPLDGPMLQLLFHHHPLPMWIYDLKTLNFLEVNAAALEKYGYSRTEFLRMNLKDIRPIEDVLHMLTDIAQPRSPLQHSGRWSHRRKDGTIIEVEIISHTLDFNKSKAALVIIQDITERKQAEEALCFSQEQLLSLIEQAPVSIAMLDREMRYLVTSRHWVTNYGRGYQNLIGRHHYEVNPDLPDRWKTVCQRGLAGEIQSNDADLWDQADGSRHWLGWTVLPWRSSQGEIGGIIISAEDITVRKEAEASLRYQATLVNNVSDAVIATDSHFNINVWNLAAEKIYGWSPDEVLGKPIRDVIPAEFPQTTEEAVMQQLNEQGYWHGELIQRAKDGTLVYVLVHYPELKFGFCSGNSPNF